MTLLRRIFGGIRDLLRRDQVEQEVDDELRAYLETAVEQKMGSGLSREVALRASRLEIGSLAAVKDHTRDAGWESAVESVWQDVRYATRTLRKAPAFATVVIIALALGTGANTAIFSIVSSLLLRPLPVQDPARLVLVKGREPGGFPEWSYPVWQQLQQRPQLFDGAFAWASKRFNLTPGGETQFVDGLWASASFFDTLGVRAVLGRTFSDADDRRGGGSDGPVAVISHGLWQRRFGGSADVVGRTLTLDRVAFTIVGVTPRSFFGPDVGRTFDVIVPLGTEPLVRGSESVLDTRGWAWLTIMARLKPGQTLDTTLRELRGLQAHIWDATLPESWPQEGRDQYLQQSFTLAPSATGDSSLRGEYLHPVMAVMVLVGLVLLITCANIANVLLARAAARRPEFVLRQTLGASRGRLVRQLLTESALLAGIGAALGLALASWGSRLLVRQLSTQENAVFLDPTIDWRTLLFTIAVALATALLVGVAAALRAVRGTAMEELKTHGSATPTGSTYGRGRPGAPGGLVVAQIALSVVLVVAAALLVSTFVALTTRPLGFERDGVLVVNMDTQQGAADPGDRAWLYEETRDAVRVLPGVMEAAISLNTPLVLGPLTILPLAGVSGDVPLAAGARNPHVNVISPGWFVTYGIRLAAGREFTGRDRAGAPRVVVVNEAFARRFFPGTSPVGQTIALAVGGPGRLSLEIVGVAADAMYGSLRSTVQPTIYLPVAQADWLPPVFMASMHLSVRTTGSPPATLAGSITAAVVAVNPAIALTVRQLADDIQASVIQERVVAMLSAFLAALTLLIAAIGIYGLTSYAVTRRRSEIGIRMALGASGAGVTRLVVRQSLMMVAAGIVLGLGVAATVTRYLEAMLFGVTPLDPATFIGVSLLFAAVATLAAFLPARRATKVDPLVALRCE